jgi:hypothetical protein
MNRRQHASSERDGSPDKTEAEKAETLREYQKLVNQIDDVVREQEIQRKAGVR